MRDTGSKNSTPTRINQQQKPTFWLFYRWFTYCANLLVILYTSTWPSSNHLYETSERLLLEHVHEREGDAPPGCALTAPSSLRVPVSELPSA